MSADETAADVIARQRRDRVAQQAAQQVEPGGAREIYGRVVVKWSLQLMDGTMLEREWTMKEVSEGATPPSGPPEWLDDALKRWDHPQDPVTYTGKVRPGHEDDARALLGLTS